MRRSRVLIASSLLATVALALTGCGTAPAANNTQRTTIDMWVADYGFPDLVGPLRELGEKFSKAHPEYEVKIEAFDQFMLADHIREAGVQGNPPEIAQYYYTSTQLGRDARNKDGQPLFTSVQQAIGGRKEILGEPVILDDILPAARSYYSYGGDLRSMPADVSTAVMYSNKTMLDAAGITEVPDTWAEIQAACEAMSNLPNAPQYCITWANHGWFYQQAVAVQGGLLADNDNGRSDRAQTLNLASPEMLAWVQWWDQLYDAGEFLHTGVQADFTGTTVAFVGQEAAFTLNSSVPADFIVGGAQQLGYEVAVSPFPHNDAVPYAGAVLGGDSLWLTAGLDQRTQDGALAFMQYLNNAENAVVLHKVGGFLPVTGAAIDALAAEGYFDEKPYQQVGLNQLSDPRRYGPTGETSAAAQGALLGDFAKIEDVMAAAMNDILVGGMDPVGRFTQANADAQLVLDAYNAAADPA